MASDPIPDHLRPILANLGLEICRPLEALRGGISRFLGDADRPISEAERTQARTMLAICDDLDRLTRERLGEPVAGDLRGPGGGD